MAGKSRVLYNPSPKPVIPVAVKKAELTPVRAPVAVSPTPIPRKPALTKSQAVVKKAPIMKSQAMPGTVGVPGAIGKKRKKEKVKKEKKHRFRKIIKAITTPSAQGIKYFDAPAKFDLPFFVIVLILIVFGLGMLLSASFDYAAREYNGDSYYFFKNQIFFAAIGLAAMIFFSFFNYNALLKKKILVPLIVGITGLMTFVAFVGIVQGGAARWMKIGSITFQPSEIMKFVLIVVLAYMTLKMPANLTRFKKGFLPFLGVILMASAITAAQPHISGAIIMFAIGLVMMVASPVKFQYVIVAILVLAALAVIARPVMSHLGYEYVETRLLGWKDPEADIQGKTFQTYQSLITIGSGGWFGTGFGESRQKFAYLPFTHNDFIFPVIVEELGFVGGIVVLLLFAILVLRGYRIATRCPDRFGMLLVVGISSQIGIQAFLNMAVATNTVPNTGISLPFFSYGGTSLVMLLAQVGVLLNVSRHTRLD
jgi:cell division protein FtsW